MTAGRTLFLMSGIVVVFVGMAKILDGMGVQNAVRACLLAAVVATFLMGEISQ